MSTIRPAVCPKGRLIVAVLLASLVAMPSPGAAKEPEARPRRPELWAMVVGIQRYEEFRQFPACYGAPDDAARVARWLIDEAGWEPGHVLILSDRDLPSLGFGEAGTRPEYRPATRANLDWGVKQWLARSVRPGDLVVIYFAGQAVGLAEAPEPARQRTPKDFLLPLDARANDLEGTGWSLGDALTGLASRGELSIVCLLDTSPAGRGQSPAVLGRPPRPGPADRMLAGISRWQGVSTWLASSGRPAGLTKDGQGHLTKSLLDALGTRAAPRNLADTLDRLRREPELARQGFRVAGGFDQRLSLWKSSVVARRRQDPPILQRGHGDRVKALAFSSDGSRMFSASMDSTLRIWHAASGTLLRTWSLLDNGCHSLALSGDGRLLVSGGGNGGLEFIDLQADAAANVTEHPHSGPVVNVAFVPPQGGGNGVTHAVLSLDLHGVSALWDASTPAVRLIGRPTLRGGRLPTAATRGGPTAFALVGERFGKELVLAYDALGNLVKDLQPPPGRVTATCLAPDGTRLWIGTETGELGEFELPKGERRTQRNLGAPIGHLAATPLSLVIAAGSSIRLEPWAAAGHALTLESTRPIGALAVSANGRRLAIADPTQGKIAAWDLDGDLAAASPLTLEPGKEPPKGIPQRTLSLAFSPEGDRLVSGDGSGAIRSWDLPRGQARPTIAAGRGRVRHLAISPDEKMLLQVSEDQVALVWDFAEQRGTRQVPGKFVPAGGFLPSGDLCLIEAEGGRNVVVHDRASLVRRPVVFDRPKAANGRALSGRNFDRLAISSKGRVAASSGEGPLACYWTPQDGKYVVGPPIRDHRGGITAIGFAGDGHSLLTAADDGLAKLWDLSGPDPRLQAEFRQEDASATRLPITAAAISPAAGGTVAIGRDGRLEIWDVGAKRPRRVLERRGQVWAVAYSADGKFLAAAGDDRTIMLRAVDQLGAPIQMSRTQSHTEQIKTLAFWPRGPVLASGSDDGTTRFWRMGEFRQLGVLSATGSGTDWVVYTPEGLFDASDEGERRVTWIPDANLGAGDPLPPRLEQIRKWHHVFDLADTLSRGQSPPPPVERDGTPAIPRSLPPEIVIEPVSRPDPKQRQVGLKIRVGEGGLSDLRLYHNGVAVQGDLRLVGSTAETSVMLVNGPNEFYALGARAGSIDGRSEPVTFKFDGATEGQTHIVALGISDYQKQKLRYAHKDARAMAEFLHKNGIAVPGRADSPPILLENSKVSRESVAAALKELRDRVKGKPEDKIVVFLAGHSEVKQGLFCMLLHDAAIPEGDPVVVMRGLLQPGGGLEPGDDPTLLPYAMVHGNLQFCDALNRLVIVDACQAQSVFDDPVVRRQMRLSMRKAADRDAHSARTSYILATRRGERGEGELALEAEPLEHGILTYSLLWGMGKADLRQLTPQPEFFRQYPSADLDGDGTVTNGELRQYSEMAIPVLIEQFPKLVMRGPRPLPESEARSSPRSEVAQDSDSSASFPLVHARARPR